MKASETKRKAVEALMEKYNIKKKDLFSFCICAVNFLEYWDEEAMIDVMYNCPEKYGTCDSDNTRAVAGALKGEMTSEECDEIDQFIWYVKMVQDRLADYADDDRNLDDYRFTENFVDRFDRCYRREVIIPYILGADIEKFKDFKWEEEGYLNGIINVKNFELLNIDNAEEEEITKKYEEEKEEKLKKSREEHKDDKDFSILVVSALTPDPDKLENLNKSIYPDRDYKVVKLPNPHTMIVQTGGKDLEDVTDRIYETICRGVIIIGAEVKPKVVKKVEDVFTYEIPKPLKDYNVTHVLIHEYERR